MRDDCDIPVPSRRRSDGLVTTSAISSSDFAQSVAVPKNDEFARGYAAYRSGDVYHVAYARAMAHGLLPGSAPYRAFVQGFFQAIRQDCRPA